jgi:hypothetical protein
MRSLMNWVNRMIFGQHIEPAPVEQHAEAMRESSKRRHEQVGKLHELDERLYFLTLEARTDAGWHESGQSDSHSPG